MQVQIITETDFTSVQDEEARALADKLGFTFEEFCRKAVSWYSAKICENRGGGI